jgi:hypothetical protein
MSHNIFIFGRMGFVFELNYLIGIFKKADKDSSIL